MDTTLYTTSCFTYHTSDSHSYTLKRRAPAAPDATRARRPTDRFVSARLSVGSSRTANGEDVDSEDSESGPRSTRSRWIRARGRETVEGSFGLLHRISVG